MMQSRCWRHGKHMCRFEWPHQPQEQLGAKAGVGEKHCLQWPWVAVAGNGTGCPRARQDVQVSPGQEYAVAEQISESQPCGTLLSWPLVGKGDPAGWKGGRGD